MMLTAMEKRGLSQQDFQQAAKRLRCDVPAIKAVGEVESRGEPFYDDGFPVILFERHKFYKYCDRDHRAEWTQKYPKICNPDAGGYGPAGRNQRNKFNLAFSLDPIAAMKSCSWGRFQIMGFNYELCGFKSVGEFVDAMKESEANQLQAFVEFVINCGLADELRNHQWEAFARGYNGANYKENNYHIKLPKAYKKFLNEKVPLISGRNSSADEDSQTDVDSDLGNNFSNQNTDFDADSQASESSPKAETVYVEPAQPINAEGPKASDVLNKSWSWLLKVTGAGSGGVLLSGLIAKFTGIEIDPQILQFILLGVVGCVFALILIGGTLGLIFIINKFRATARREQYAHEQNMAMLAAARDPSCNNVILGKQPVTEAVN